MAGMFDFYPTDYQLDFAYSCMTERRIISVWCRQTGKSFVTARVAIMLAADEQLEGNRVLIFAPTERQTEVLGRYINDAIDKMCPTEFRCIRKTQSEFKFTNGCTIVCMTANSNSKGETIRGETAKAIIIEEAGSIKDYVYSSVILPMGGTTNPVIIKIGTPRGKNHFFESSVNSKWTLHQIGWERGVKAGILKKDIVDEMKDTMTDIQFRTECCAEFIEDQDSFFSYELIENCVDETLKWDLASYDKLYTYYLGADIARMGQDATCLTVVRVLNQKAEVCQIVEIAKSDLTYVIERIEELHNYYHFKRMFLDETGLGAGVTDLLAKKYNQMRMQQGKNMVAFAKQTEYADKVVGVKFTIQSKLDMFSNLKVIMSGGRIKYPRHPKLVAELRDFRYELTENMNVKLHHSEHGHDDFVDALALACKEVNVKKPGWA